MMPEITLYLVIEHPEHFGSGTRYTHTMETPFRPMKGERIILFAYDNDHPGDGPTGCVHEVYWYADGRVAVALEHYVVDPNESMEQRVRASIRSIHKLHGWYSDRDGDLPALLRQGGWSTWT